MRLIVLCAAALALGAFAWEPRLTLDYPAIASRVVGQLALKPGEKVLSIAAPGVFEQLIPYIRYEVMRAGAIDAGVVSVLAEPFPESFDLDVLERGARDARAAYKAMFGDIDAAIMMPGATTAHPAYLAMQDLLRDDLKEHRGRRTVHFHWVENGSAYTLPGQPLPPRYEIDRIYQHALLRTDYAALAAAERRLAQALRSGEVHITSAAGTDLKFRAGDRPINLQDGDASKGRAAAGRVLIDHEIELPAGVVRVAPIEESVEGVVVFPASQWDGRPVEGLKLRFARGRVVELTATAGREWAASEIGFTAPGGSTAAAAAGSGRGEDARRTFREFALGLNPLLSVPSVNPWIPYYGYGAGVVRLSLGDNTELGGAVGGGYVRWNFFTDLTVHVAATEWVRAGTLVR